MSMSINTQRSRAVLPKIGVIADDFTGGTDIASFLVNGGLSAIQVTQLDEQKITIDVDAIVVSLKSRSCPAEEAVALSLEALRWLQQQGCERIYFKYCSTFDSTAQGNIGPVTDSLLEALGQDATVLCPALPVNGRTVYRGYLFVNGVPLDESGMRNHPVTPMRDASVMRLMASQALGRAANIPFPVIDAGVQAVRHAIADLRQAGYRYLVPDALTSTHLETIAEACQDHTLLTGGSGLAGGLATVLTRGASVSQTDAGEAGHPADGGKTVILSGSCSVMTNAQVAAYAAQAPTLSLEVARCITALDGYVDEVADWVCRQQGALAPLVHSTAGDDVARIQARYGAQQASTAVEAFFAQLALTLAQQGVDHFIVAGGETSGAVMQRLQVGALLIGPQIAPGVPWVRAANAPRFFALKSGNFGDERFFFTAQDFYQKENK